MKRKATDERLAQTPPHNLEAEASVVGAILLSPAAVVKVRDFLTPEDFYDSNLEKLYAAILDVVDEGGIPDIVSVSSRLLMMGETLNVELPSFYIAELANRVPSAANIEHYAKLVREQAILRSVISVATMAATHAYDPQKDVGAFLDSIEKHVLEVTRSRVTRGAATASEGVDAVLARYRQPAALMIKTGIPQIDNVMGGFGRGRLYAVGGRPGDGKTVLGLGVSTSLARSGVGVLYHTLEMPKDELLLRDVSAQLGIENQDVQNGVLTDRERAMVEAELEAMRSLPLYIREDHGPWMRHLATYEAMLALHPNLSVIVVDHLNLINEGFDHKLSRYLQLGQVTKSLKTLAKKWNIVVIVLAQLKRPEGKQANREPWVSDFKESGCVEEDSDGCLLISVPTEAGSQAMDVIIGKMRGGRKGRFRLYYDERYVRIGDWDSRWDYREVGRML